MKCCIILKSIKLSLKINLRKNQAFAVRSRGRIFLNEFSEFCTVHEIIHERMPPYSPQSNEIAERKNRTLTELVNAMLETAGLGMVG